MEYVNNRKKNQQQTALTGAGNVARPRQSAEMQSGGVNNTPNAIASNSGGTNNTPKAVSSSGSYTSTTVRPGVSAETQAALAGYESGYTPSQTVQDAEAYLNQILGQKPGEYVSPYAQQLDDLYTQITGRGPFTYDLNADMLYQQYKDQYTRMGQQAMMDTMGQAAGLTGGYGSSYAQNAGQQAYNGYLQQLNERIPELYDRAYNAWLNEGNELYKRYGLLGDRENDAYGRWRDLMGDWRSDLSFAYDRYGDERSFDYGSWADMMAYWQDKADRENSDYWTQTQWDYQKERDAIADAQWEKEFNAAQAARAASAQSTYDKAYQDAWQTFLDKYKMGNENYESVPGTVQGRVEIPGYGTVNWQQYLDLLAKGLVEKVTKGKNGNVAIFKKRGGTGYDPFNMVM